MVNFFKRHINFWKLLGIISLAVLVSRIVIYLTFVFYSIINKTSFDLNNFFIAINKFDARWYRDIVLYGYRVVDWDPCKYSWNFFPLYPLIIKLVHFVIPVDPYVLGLIINSIMLVFVCFMSYKYLLLTRINKKIAYIAIFLLCFGPWSMYTIELMSETLFMLLLISILYCMKTNRLILMGVFGAFLSATRSNGVLIVIPIILYFYITNGEETFKSKILSILKNSKLLFAICLIPIGVFSYMLYLQITIHDGLGFIHSQKFGWGHEFKGIFYVIFQSIREMPLLVIFICLSLLIIVYLIKEGRMFEALFPLLTLLLQMPYTLQSSPRYMFGTLTIMFGFLDMVQRVKLSKNKIFQITLFAILFVLEIELSSFLMFNKFTNYVV